MRSYAAIRERYLRDELPIRLGGLAANLARVGSFSDHEGHREAVERLLDESKLFIEWTGPDMNLLPLEELVGVQRELARWRHDWALIWPDSSRRNAVAERAAALLRQVLEISGLLRREALSIPRRPQDGSL